MAKGSSVCLSIHSFSVQLWTDPDASFHAQAVHKSFALVLYFLIERHLVILCNLILVSCLLGTSSTVPLRFASSVGKVPAFPQLEAEDPYSGVLWEGPNSGAKAVPRVRESKFEAARREYGRELTSIRRGWGFNLHACASLVPSVKLTLTNPNFEK